MPTPAGRPIGFAHRGMRGRAPDNSIAGFRMALETGAPGLEGDVWASADDRPVLDHDGVVRGAGRPQAIAGVPRERMPAPLCTLDELYAECGADFELSLDVKDPRALDPTLAAARAADAEDRLWLCHPDWRLVASWRPLAGRAHLVDSTRLRRIREGPGRRLRSLSDAGVDVLNLPWVEWSAPLVAMCHEAGVLAFAWDVQREDVLRRMVGIGIDAVYSDDVAMMVRVLQEPDPTQRPDPNEGAAHHP